MVRSDPGVIFVLIIVAMVFATGIIIALGSTWIQHKARIRAIEVLKIYAERGEEPPAGVLDAVNQIGKAPPSAPAHAPAGPATRTDHLSHVAGSAVLAIGAAGVAWWQAPEHGNPGPLMVLAIVAAVFFAGSAAARLAAALTTRDGRG